MSDNPVGDDQPDGATYLARIDRLERRVARERAARKQAERLIEDKSRELWEANAALAVAVGQLEHQSSHDPLTGLANRRALSQWMLDRQRRAPRTGNQVGVLSLDLDHFKDVNDSLGHAAGDEYLQAIAARLVGTVRDEDLVIRLGGDELLILLNGVHSLDECVAVAGKVNASVRGPLLVAGTTLHPTTSIGVSLFQDGEDPEDALRRADAALYAAKAAGRDQIIAVEQPG